MRVLALVVVAACFGVTAPLPAFEKCEHDGWSCASIGSDKSVAYEQLIFTCSYQTGRVVTLDLEVEEIHHFTKNVIVQNCWSVSLKLRQTLTLDKTIALTGLVESITIQNVMELNLIDASSKFVNPQTIIFKHIGFIPVIPAYTFTSCNGLKVCNAFKAENIIIENVTIGKIENQAFEVLDASVTIKDAFVTLVDTRAIEIQNTEASVEIINSTFRIVESNAYKFYSPKVVIMKCKFLEELREQSLQVLADSFLFYLNEVNIIHPNAFNITAQNISFVSNILHNVSSGSFAEVYPSLHDPDLFFYQFRENEINWAEPLALYHNWESYEDEIDPSNLLITDNHFNCSCDLWGFIELSPTGKREKTSKLDFYDLLLIEDKNECINPYCHIPLSNILKLLHNESRNGCISSKELYSLCSLINVENETNSSFSKKISEFLFILVTLYIL